MGTDGVAMVAYYRRHVHPGRREGQARFSRAEVDKRREKERESKKLEDFRRALSINSSNLANCRPIGGHFLFNIIVKWKDAQKEQIRHFFLKKKEYFWM